MPFVSCSRRTPHDQHRHRPSAHASARLANEIRLARAELRQHVRAIRNYEAGCAELATLIGTPPVCMASLRIEIALRWVYRMQHTKVVDCLAAAQCSPYKKVGELSERQRKVIAFWLSESTNGRSAA